MGRSLDGIAANKQFMVGSGADAGSFAGMLVVAGRSADALPQQLVKGHSALPYRHHTSGQRTQDLETVRTVSR